MIEDFCLIYQIILLTFTHKVLKKEENEKSV